MNSLHFTVIAVLCAAVNANTGSAPWGYIQVESGTDVLLPANWGDSYALCAGDMQSPIDIDYSCMMADTSDVFTQFTFKDYDNTAIQWEVTNSGHSIKVQQASADTSPIPMEVSGGGLTAGRSYRFAQYHVHWGANDNEGSEHTVDGSAYPMELHLVHYDAEYATFADSLAEGARDDALVVLGVMFQIDDSAGDNTLAQQMIDAAPQIADMNGVTAFSTIALRSLLPANTERFFRYKGSLTTPTCNEVVQWTVFADPVTVTSAQMASLRTLFKFPTGQTMSTNFRPAQALGSRVITSSFTDGITISQTCASSASAVHVSFLVIAIFSLVAIS